jgi:hypothetical protein
VRLFDGGERFALRVGGAHLPRPFLEPDIGRKSPQVVPAAAPDRRC